MGFLTSNRLRAPVLGRISPKRATATTVQIASSTEATSTDQ
jgi:hypothetical protein